MATLRDIKARIKSVSNIRKITRAMQLVAAAKLNKAQERAHTVRPYADEMDRILGALAGMASGDESGDSTVELAFAEGPDARAIETTRAMLFEHRDVRRIGLVLVTSDRGLCGAFNTNLIRAAEKFLAENADKECRLITLGRKGYNYFKRRPTPILFHKEGIDDKLDLPQIKEITGRLVQAFLDGQVDALYILYAKSIRAALYRVTTQQFLPIPAVEAGGGEENYIMEPDRDQVFARLIPLYATTTIFSALADSFASEYGAKMAAMRQATKNADEKVNDLIIERNRMRQATITRELAEIVGGAEALK
jgi:F-type H+-transporting ATPase subunit gamma